jgi:hypothetical protein
MAKTREKALSDPRRALALEYYSDATSETFGNASRSLERAGFKPSYARNSCEIEWLNAHRASFHVDLIKKAEKNLDRIASINVKLDTKLNVEVAKLQADVSKFIVDRLAQGKYGKGTEQVAPAITVNIVAPKAPSASRDAQVVEPDQLDAPSA